MPEALHRFTNWLSRRKYGEAPPSPVCSAHDESLSEHDAYSIEVANDDETPMDFVVYLLVTQLNLSAKDATDHVLYVHTRGKTTIGRMPLPLAERVAHNFAAFSAKHRWPLQCRVVRSCPSV